MPRLYVEPSYSLVLQDADADVVDLNIVSDSDGSLVANVLTISNAGMVLHGGITKDQAKKAGIAINDDGRIVRG